ncbi:hypothetical protein SLEP1_g1521 [Rubroshorea leprosula]|uniref:SWIM-type domain-containing protein n=1 Tax=Rubroshorea leprosula TaxID=152421 RepID=A0AAV5HIN2_9ROSI|nr:hypothetical protein SLEP1_g1521 [Rubroshorea leprosula]
MSAEIIDINLEGDLDGSGNEVRFLSTNLLLRCVKVMLNGWGCLVIVLVSDECSKKVGKVGFTNICLLTYFLKKGIWSPPYVFFMGQFVYLYGSNKGDWGIEKHVLFIHIGGRLIQDNGLKYVDGECWYWHVDIDKLTVRELFQKISIARYDPDMVEHIWCVIGVDGAFLKGAYKGVLLVAVGRDANDRMYPLAWSVVEGIINAIKELFPDAKHRRCARHVYANFRKDNRGKELQRAFWKCAKATTEADFIKAFGELTNIKQRARVAVLKVHPQFWSKAFFKEDSKSNVVDNNMCEVFNGLIVDSRHKAIFSMLEDLRMMCGRRTVARRTFVDEKFVGDFGPKIWEKIIASREGSKRCRVLWPGYEVEEEDKGKFIVDMNRRTCTCRCWNMTGIPCKHVVSVIKLRKEKDEHYSKKRQKKGSTSSATRPGKGGRSGARG